VFCTCFKQHLPAALLAEQCTVTIDFVREPVFKALVTFTCEEHGREHRHSVYPNTPDWDWVASVKTTEERVA
jgi:hypothetical protein